MSIDIYRHNPDHSSVRMNAFDGTFSDSPRSTPYLYLTINTDGIRQSISIDMNELTGSQLRALAERADEFWDAWQDYRIEQAKEPAA